MTRFSSESKSGDGPMVPSPGGEWVEYDEAKAECERLQNAATAFERNWRDAEAECAEVQARVEELMAALLAASTGKKSNVTKTRGEGLRPWGRDHEGDSND